MAGSRRLTDLSADVLGRSEGHLPAGRLVVALSGGADSAVCAWAAAGHGSEVRAVHVDHRWPASPVLERAARAIAGQLGIDLTVVQIGSTSGPSPEGRARSARYAALQDELQEGEWLLT